MPRIVVTPAARESLERCRRFLAARNPLAAVRAGRTIGQQFKVLETAPGIGRPYGDSLELRELVIGFGGSGYVALYRYDAELDAVYVLAFRHQREAGW